MSTVAVDRRSQSGVYRTAHNAAAAGQGRRNNAHDIKTTAGRPCRHNPRVESPIAASGTAR